MEKLKELWKKYQEMISYLVFGGLTTLVNYATYFAFTRALGVNEIISNVIAWLFSVIFAYITNKIWVFNSKTNTFSGIIREISMFFAARVFSGVLDTALLFLLYTCWGISDIFVKIFNGILVVVLNYFFSKFIIFRKKKEGEKA